LKKGGHSSEPEEKGRDQVKEVDNGKCYWGKEKEMEKKKAWKRSEKIKYGGRSRGGKKRGSRGGDLRGNRGTLTAQKRGYPT